MSRWMVVDVVFFFGAVTGGGKDGVEEYSTPQ